MKKGENIMKKFWIVMGEAAAKISEKVLNEGDATDVKGVNTGCNFGFDTELQAIKVAEAQAVKYPGEEYYVMESVKCSKAEVKAVTT